MEHYKPHFLLLNYDISSNRKIMKRDLNLNPNNHQLHEDLSDIKVIWANGQYAEIRTHAYRSRSSEAVSHP